MKKITLIGTGGTIDKTYNEFDGTLKNYSSIISTIIERLRLPDTEIIQQNIIHKDSLELNDEDRDIILKITRQAMENSDAVVILHGTDTLSVTGHLLYDEIPNPKCPIILTGAMRPFVFKDTDAMQNVAEALLAAKILNPGIFTVIHNTVLEFPGIHKDKKRLTFVKE